MSLGGAAICNLPHQTWYWTSSQNPIESMFCANHPSVILWLIMSKTDWNALEMFKHLIYARFLFNNSARNDLSTRSTCPSIKLFTIYLCYFHVCKCTCVPMPDQDIIQKDAVYLRQTLLTYVFKIYVKCKGLHGLFSCPSRANIAKVISHVW